MRYVLSRLFVTRDPRSNEIYEPKTGNRLTVTPEVLRLLSLFSRPTTLANALANVSGSNDEKAAIRSFISTLVDQKILVKHPQQHDAPVQFMEVVNRALVHETKNTMFGSPSRTLESLKDETIIFLGVPFDLGTTGYPGARFAPDKMRELCADAFVYNADILSGNCRGWFCLRAGGMALTNVKMADIGNAILVVGEGFDQFFNRVTRIVRRVVRKGGFPVIIGGDHSITYASVRAMTQECGPVDVIHLDAHTDLGDLDREIANNHGNVFTRLFREKLISGLHQFGIRAMIGSALRRPGYSLAPMNELKRKSSAALARRLDPTRKYFLSLDIDVLDPAYAPGTGTPVSDGMSPTVLLDLIDAFVNSVEIVGLDLVEVNPMRDSNNITSDLAVKLLFDILARRFR